MAGGHAWWGVCKAGGMHGRGGCVAGGRAWQGGICGGGGRAWQGGVRACHSRYYGIRSMSGVVVGHEPCPGQQCLVFSPPSGLGHKARHLHLSHSSWFVITLGQTS